MVLKVRQHLDWGKQCSCQWWIQLWWSRVCRHVSLRLRAGPEEPWRGSRGVTACVRLFTDSCDDDTRRGGTLQEWMRRSLELFWKMREVCSVFNALSVMILSDGLDLCLCLCAYSRFTNQSDELIKQLNGSYRTYKVTEMKYCNLDWRYDTHWSCMTLSGLLQ